MVRARGGKLCRDCSNYGDTVLATFALKCSIGNELVRSVGRVQVYLLLAMALPAQTLHGMLLAQEPDKTPLLKLRCAWQETATK